MACSTRVSTGTAAAASIGGEDDDVYDSFNGASCQSFADEEGSGRANGNGGFAPAASAAAAAAAADDDDDADNDNDKDNDALGDLLATVTAAGTPFALSCPDTQLSPEARMRLFIHGL